MERLISKYTLENDRGLIYEGIFVITDDINIGDEILVHHICRYCEVNLLMKVIGKVVAFYFNDIPQYDYIVGEGSSYKSNTKHISIYDKIVGICEFSKPLNKVK